MLTSIHVISYGDTISEKFLVFKFQYFRKYMIQLYDYSYVHVSGQRHAGLER